jgi:hypothetical protein
VTTVLQSLRRPAAPCRVPSLRAVSPADGHDPRALERWCRDGGLVWVAEDVYLPVDVASTPAARREALALLTPSGATVAMATAVWCRGGPGLAARLPFAADDGRPRVELLVAGGRSPRPPRPQVRTRQSALASHQVERLGPVRVTTGARTAVDLARWGAGVPDEEALAWLWAHAVTPRAAGALLRDQRRSPGVRRVRRVLAAVRDGDPHPLDVAVDDGAPADGPGHAAAGTR